MNNLSPDTLIAIGKLSATHGIRGELKFFPYSDSAASFKKGLSVSICLKNGLKLTETIQNIRTAAKCYIIKFSSSDSIEDAEKFAGGEISLYRSQLPETEEDEYYWCDLIGLDVFTYAGLYLGKVTDIMATGSNDNYVVTDEENREYLIPAIADVIQQIDIKAQKIIITPLQGLLDL